MSSPFPEANLEPLIYLTIGALSALVISLTFYVRRLHRKIDGEINEKGEVKELKVDNIGLTKKSQDLMNQILEEPELQSDLPDNLKVSKATVSNAISELKERGLIKRKKRANTYLIEPDIDELEKQQK